MIEGGSTGDEVERVKSRRESEQGLAEARSPTGRSHLGGDQRADHERGPGREGGQQVAPLRGRAQQQSEPALASRMGMTSHA